jgi:hypothetical protein
MTSKRREEMTWLWDGLLGILAPNKYLHNRSLRDSDAHERMRQEINTALALKCLTMAENGSAVELKCTNGGWVELRVVPRDGEPPFTYNGRTINDKTELERRN